MQECVSNAQCGTCSVCNQNKCQAANAGATCSPRQGTASAPGICTAPAADGKPGSCVECMSDANCSGATPKCNLATNTCLVSKGCKDASVCEAMWSSNHFPASEGINTFVTD
jgi:hypothetical protein